METTRRGFFGLLAGAAATAAGVPTVVDTSGWKRVGGILIDPQALTAREYGLGFSVSRQVLEDNEMSREYHRLFPAGERLHYGDLVAIDSNGRAVKAT